MINAQEAKQRAYESLVREVDNAIHSATQKGKYFIEIQLFDVSDTDFNKIWNQLSELGYGLKFTLSHNHDCYKLHILNISWR